jgi:hypothetical protein
MLPSPLENLPKPKPLRSLTLLLNGHMAVDHNERHGVWAGVDRTVRPGKAAWPERASPPEDN